MPDLAPTGISLTRDTKSQTILLGEACSICDVVYKASDGRFMLAQAAAGKESPSYILASGGVENEYVLALPLAGEFKLAGVTLVVGTQYVLSANAGKMAPKTDLLTGDLLTELCVGQTTDQARFSLDVTGVAMP